jgi:hypothetical protein
MRVLDEVADAVRIARGGITAPVKEAVALEEILGGPITRAQCAALQRHLDCPVPLWEFDQGHWFQNDTIVTVWDVVDHVARHHPDWELPAERTPAAWREAQVFVGVRKGLVEALSLDPNEVVRSARVMRDLHFE